MAITLKAHILKALAELNPQDAEERINARIDKYSQMGRYAHRLPKEETTKEPERKKRASKKS
jgi:DNA invertase Pin-like site-specific DNA recombinase